MTATGDIVEAEALLMSSTSDSATPLISKLANDPTVSDLVELFVAELPARVAALERAWSENDPAGLLRLVHRLKGAAGGYGFPTIRDAARELETALSAGSDPRRVASALDRVRGLCLRARASAPGNPQ